MYMQDMDFDKMFPQVPECIEDERRYISDYNYFKNMYPARLRLVAGIIEDYLDRFEYEGSSIYMEYPDQVSIYRIASHIYNMFCQVNREEFEDTQEIIKFKEVIQIMVCQEIYIRRRRKERFMKRFCNVR